MQPVQSIQPVGITWLPMPPREQRALMYEKKFSIAAETRSTTATKGRRHTHKCFEIVIVHQGAIILSLDTSTQVLTAGDAIIFHGSLLHGGRTLGSAYTRTAFHLNINKADVIDWCKLIPADAKSFVYAYLPQTCYPAFFENLTKLSEQPAKGDISQQDTDLVANVLSTLQVVERPKQAALHPVVRESIKLMTQMNTATQISDLARRLYISQSHLFALFHNNLMCSPYQLWMKIRIEQACNKILKEQIPVNDLVKMFGFTTRRSFERAFRRYTGTTVSQYRELGWCSSW